MASTAAARRPRSVAGHGSRNSRFANLDSLDSVLVFAIILPLSSFASCRGERRQTFEWLCSISYVERGLGTPSSAT